VCFFFFSALFFSFHLGWSPLSCPPSFVRQIISPQISRPHDPHLPFEMDTFSLLISRPLLFFSPPSLDPKRSILILLVEPPSSECGRLFSSPPPMIRSSSSVDWPSVFCRGKTNSAKVEESPFLFFAISVIPYTPFFGFRSSDSTLKSFPTKYLFLPPRRGSRGSFFPVLIVYPYFPPPKGPSLEGKHPPLSSEGPFSFLSLAGGCGPCLFTRP